MTKRDALLLKGLQLALLRLAQYEPADSRATSSEFVALAAVVDGVNTERAEAVIDAALAAMEEK